MDRLAVAARALRQPLAHESMRHVIVLQHTQQALAFEGRVGGDAELALSVICPVGPSAELDSSAKLN
jgi:hypothetical protein